MPAPTRRHSRRGSKGRSPRRIRYAVLGLGHISQVAALPAFAHARRNSELVALVSGDAAKRRKLGERYRVPSYAYEDCADLFGRGEVDAVYLGLPNHLHCAYAVLAARAGVHVLCEKPMALTELECRQMIQEAEDHAVKLMVAYRLHFEGANLEALALARSGRVGEPRLFQSTFTMQVKPGNIRVRRETGGGTLYDIGIYCLQAARQLFGSDPVAAFAMSASGDDPRFSEVDEMTSAVLRFPENRLAAFTTSFGAADVSAYRLVGTQGDLRVEPAYEYQSALAHQLTVAGRRRTRRYAKRDQFAPELLHFSDCILRGREPEPSGIEGMIDVAIIEALLRSAKTGRTVELPRFPKERQPTRRQRKWVPPVRKPKLVRAESASS
jgi:glucose-fructose oxidoreductase